MTYDFAPYRLNTLATATDFSAAESAPLLSPAMTEVAALVEELFAEGTLSYAQLRSLSSLPELSPLLAEAVAGVPTRRRLASPAP